MKRGLLTFACVALATLAWSGRSQAQDAKGFGSKGQLIISADRLFPLFSYTSVSTTETNNNDTVTTTDKGSSLVLLIGEEPNVGTVHTVPRVAADFTVIDRLTVGGSIVLAFGLGASEKVEDNNNGTTRSISRDAPSRTIIGIGPRVGYILPLNDWLAFWPRGGFSFYSVRDRSVDTDNNGNVQRTTTDSDTIFSLDLDPQLAIVPVGHFFFNVGPLINIPLTGSRKHEVTTGGTTTSTSIDLSVFHFGLSAGLGGWLDL